MRKPKQLCLPEPKTWGGKRKGAGRKPKPGRPSTPHRKRPEHKKGEPLHVTMRARAEVGSFRRPLMKMTVERSVAEAQRPDFRVVHHSMQDDHLHLIVEAEDKVALSSGMTGLASRAARAINRALGRTGQVWADRFHHRPMTTPREVRHGLVYVLYNFRKHHPKAKGDFDPYSSAPWFDGFTRSAPPTLIPPPVARAQTWLLRTGWRERGGGLIDPSERPAPKR